MSHHEVSEGLLPLEFNLDHFELSILDGKIDVCQDKINQLFTLETKSMEINWEDGLDIWHEAVAESSQHSLQEPVVDILG